MSSITMRYCEGSSDKVYACRIVPKEDGFVVNVEYGRYGGSLKVETKTSQPLALPEAEKIFNKLVREKKAKGYTESQDGKAYTGTELAGRDTGYRVQLLNPVVTDSELSGLINDPAWVMQEKYDAERRLLILDGCEVTGSNRKGLAVPLALEVVELVQSEIPVFGLTILDVEDFGTTVAPFDILFDGGVDIRHLPYAKRLEHLERLVRNIPQMPTLKNYYSAADKKAELEALRARGAEGVVFKRLDAEYVPGRPASLGDQRKYKFYESATCRVIEQNIGKRSVSFELMDQETGLWHMAGNCTIPPNFGVPAKGAIISVVYLYAYKGGSLYQPSYGGIRRDQDDSDCTIGQLKFKAEPGHALDS